MANGQFARNPFSDELAIEFDRSETGKTTLVLANLIGQVHFFENENGLEKGHRKSS